MLEPYVGFKVAIRRIWWRISSVKYVLKMKMKWALKLLQDINMMKNEEWSASSRWAISKRSFAWVLPSIWWSWICEDAPKKKFSHGGLWGSNPHGGHGYVKMRRRRSSPMVDYGGAIHKTSSSKHKQERRSILLRSRSSSSSSSGMRKYKVCSW